MNEKSHCETHIVSSIHWKNISKHGLSQGTERSLYNHYVPKCCKGLYEVPKLPKCCEGLCEVQSYQNAVWDLLWSERDKNYEMYHLMR